MAVYYKYKCAISKDDYRSIAVDGAFISVGVLLQRIRATKHFCSDPNHRKPMRDFMVVTNAQTNEQYLEEAALIPRDTSVIIRRLPGPPSMAIGIGPGKPKEEDKVDAADSGGEPDWDDFGPDLFEATPKPKESGADDADGKIKALVNNNTTQYQCQYQGLPTPPQGYVCHRCNVAGHFIQHCPTNGDPNYDIKRVKPPTGIPKSMLLATGDGSYALSSGQVAVLTPDQATFEKEMEGLSSAQSSSLGALPPELHCPLCRQVMKDAVLTSKCCFNSFCDKCIRNYLMSTYKSNSGCVCLCGATHSLADDLLPNMTLRETISRMLASASGSTSSSSGSSSNRVKDMPSSTLSVAASNGEVTPNSTTKPTVVAPPQQILDQKVKATKVADEQLSEVTHESMTVKKPAESQRTAPLVQEEQVQQMLPSASGEAGKKRKWIQELAMPAATDLQCQWGSSQDQYPAAADNYMMPISMDPTAYNAYWNWMPGMAPYGGPMPLMGYGFGDQGYMMPMVPPQRYELNNDDRHFKRKRSEYAAVVV